MLHNSESCDKEVDIDYILNIYLKITGIISSVFRPQKTLMKTRITLNNTLFLVKIEPTRCHRNLKFIRD